VVDERWSLTDDEDTHNDDEDDGNVLLIPVFTHLRPTSLSALQCTNQLDVEKGDEQQRTAVDDDEVEDVGVNDAIKSITAKGADFEHLLRLVDSNTYRDALVLEEPLLLYTRVLYTSSGEKHASSKNNL